MRLINWRPAPFRRMPVHIPQSWPGTTVMLGNMSKSLGLGGLRIGCPPVFDALARFGRALEA